ncbi:MAG: hypothetical protein KIG39_06755, partial [Lachnospiraceae bacterium]|nr:hypothetical protein [Lachnospiraceae bacterium]
DSFVNAVYLYEEKVILTFNYKDGSKTITLEDVEGSDLSAFGARKEYFFDEKYLSEIKVRRFLKSPYFFCLRNRRNLFYEQFF